jgi:hypothetical protein
VAATAGTVALIGIRRCVARRRVAASMAASHAASWRAVSERQTRPTRRAVDQRQLNDDPRGTSPASKGDDVQAIEKVVQRRRHPMLHPTTGRLEADCSFTAFTDA